MKKLVEIKVMGQKFNVRSDSSEEYVHEVAQYVDQKLSEIANSTKTVSSLNVAILAAMNIADEFMKYKKTQEKVTDSAEKKIRGVLELIDLQT